MSFGFGVGDLIATSGLLIATIETLNKNAASLPDEVGMMVAEMRVGLGISKALTQYLQTANPRVFESRVLPVVMRLSEATADLARGMEHVVKNGGSKWSKVLWASKKLRLERDSSRFKECVTEAQLVLSLLVSEGMEAAEMHHLLQTTSASPKPFTAATPILLQESARVDSMPLTVTTDMSIEMRRADSLFTLPVDDHEIDIILVPDLGGHPQETWKSFNSTWIPDLVSNKSLSPNIIHFGYRQTSILAGDFTQGLKVEAKQLLDLLTYRIKGRSTIIVCHGIGCCLVKTAITYGAKAARYDSDYSTALCRLKCIVNLGMPKWAIAGCINRHLNMLRITARTRALRRVALLSTWIAQHPMSLSEYAARIDREFLSTSETYSITKVDCCESQYIIADDSLLMVSQPSLLTPVSTPLLLEGNYFTMCQFQKQESANFDRLRKFLNDCVGFTPSYQDEKSQQLSAVLSSPTFVGRSELLGAQGPPPRANADSDDERIADQSRIPTLPEWQKLPDAGTFGYISSFDILHFQWTLFQRTFAFKQSLMPLVFPTTQLATEDVTTRVWIRDTQAYRQWYSLAEASRPLPESTESDASSRALLCITGDVMTGKSTLLRFITETFGDRGSVQAEQITRLVHICDENILCSRMPYNILKSLIWQLLEEYPHLYTNICHQYPKAPVSFDELGLVFIRLLLDVSSLVLITIDNLECAFGGDIYETAVPGAHELVPLLEQLASLNNVKILTTCISPRFKLCHQVNLSDFGEEQESALTNFSRAEMEKHAVISLRSHNVRERLRADLCAASRGSFLRLLIGIRLLSSVRKEDDFDSEVQKYEKSDTFSLLADIGSQNIRQVAILAVCKESVSLEELAIISGSLGPREDLNKSAQSKSFVKLLALKSLDVAAEFAPLEGIFFHIRNGLYYPSTRLVARVMSAPSNQGTLKSWSQSLANLCVATLKHYSVFVNTETLENVAPLCQHSSVTDEHYYRMFYPFLTYAVRHWMQYIYDCDRTPIALGDFLKKQRDFARMAAGLSEDVYKRFSDTNQLQGLESWIARRDKATKFIPVCDNPSEVDAALAEAGLRKDRRAIRGLLDSYHQMLGELNLKELFSGWIRDAIKSDDPKTACFPLEILDMSRGKEPSQLDICFDHEQELHHLFRLAIKNSYWGVADGIWTALTESATLDWSEWIKKHGSELLYEAVRSGNCSIVTALVNREVGSDYASPDGITLLQIAAAMGVEDIIEVLTATATGTREEFNQSGTDAVDTKEDDTSEADSQLSDNPPVQSCRQTALMVASASGFVDIVRLLLNASWDFDDRDYVDNGDAEGRSALHFAVLFGHEAVVNELLLAGAKIEQKDTFGRTPMHMAAAGNWDGLIELLCKQGASAGTKDNQGLTPLHVAAYNGSTRAASRLVLRAPASVHMRDKKNVTPLHAAAEYGSESITRLLLENRAPCDARTKDGNMPLHLAAKTKHPSDALLQLLLGKSKDPRGKNKQGLTPSEVARKHGNSLLVERLLASEQRDSPLQEEALYKRVLSQTPFSTFSLQVEKLSSSTAAQNLRAGYPDHFLSRAIEDLRRATESVGAEHGRLGPDAIWNSTGANFDGRTTRDRQFRPPTPTT